MKFKFSISCVIMLLLVSCNDYWNSVCGGDYIVQLSNNTGDTIYVFAFYNSDTIAIVEEKQAAQSIPNDKSAIVFESDYECEKLKDTIQYFIINKDTLSKYGLKYTLETYNILLRYSMTGADFGMLEYSIPYPPTPSMQNMKMYPSYEEIISSPK